MNKIPFKTIGICSAILTALIVLRCIVSAGRVLYYGGTYWMTVIQADPWLYVGIAASAISAVCFAMVMILQRQQDTADETDEAYEEDFEDEFEDDEE